MSTHYNSNFIERLHGLQKMTLVPESDRKLQHPGGFYLEEMQRAVQLMVEENISSIYQMPE